MIRNLQSIIISCLPGTSMSYVMFNHSTFNTVRMLPIDSHSTIWVATASVYVSVFAWRGGKRTVFCLFFSIPFIIFALLFSLPPSRNSDPESHSRLFPPTHCGSCLAFFSREDFSSSLGDSRRIVLAHTLGALNNCWSFFFFFANKFNISPRRDSNSRTNTVCTGISSFRL